MLNNGKNIKMLPLFLGILFLFYGIYMSVFLKNPHFYSFFSIGLSILTLIICNLQGQKLFNKWSFKKHIFFWFLLFFISIIIDQAGIYLGYWSYPYYNSLFDEIQKLVFEYVVSFIYFMNIFLIGVNLFKKINVNEKIPYLLSLLTFSPLSLLLTEYINSFSNSWIFNIPTLYWYIFGSWLLAIIPFIVYNFVQKIPTEI